MLRIHFTEADLARVRVATEPDPMWEVLSTLHRLQSRGGRRQFAAWHRTMRADLNAAGLGRPVRRALFALYPLGPYLPDFLTPPESEGGIAAALDGILRLPRQNVLAELRLLDRVSAVPSWALRLGQEAERREFTELIRRYHAVAVAPFAEPMAGGIVAHRSLLARALLTAGSRGSCRAWDPGCGGAGRSSKRTTARTVISICAGVGSGSCRRTSRGERRSPSPTPNSRPCSRTR